MVRAVLFDLDDTLFDHQLCARTAIAKVRSAHPCLAAVDAAVVEQTHARILEDLHRDVMLGRIGLDAARVERFRRLIQGAGGDADDEAASRAAAAYREEYINARQPVAGAAGLLRAVRQRARIGIVSNNLLAEQREKLRHCGLEPYVDALVVSEETGVAKPDPRIFEIALQRLDVRKEDAVMVGDSWPADIVGAQRAGIRAIWFNRTGETPADPGVTVVRTLNPPDELLRELFTK